MADVPPDIRCHPLQRKTPPWKVTLVAQVFLCAGLYLAFRVGVPLGALQKKDGIESSWDLSSGTSDIHFLSVAGGSRSMSQQTQLLRWMNMAARIYSVKFVLCLAEFGENDAFLFNTTLSFEALRVPWITTEVSCEQDKGYYLKQFESHGKVLDIIVLDTRSWKVNDIAGSVNQQLDWLTGALESSNGIWRLVAGIHPLNNCDDDRSTSGNRSVYSNLSSLFLKHRVDLYISKYRCSTTSGYTSGIPYMSKLGHVDKESGASLRIPSHEIDRRLVDGFHLHRVGPLEMETYSINLAGDVASEDTVHHLGREGI